MKLYHSRFLKLGKTLSKLGFEKLLATPSLQKYLPDRVKSVSDEYTLYERIRMAMEELGSTFVKFGQLLSQRADLFPEDFIKEMEKLQDNVKAEEIDVKQLFKDTTNINPNTIFKTIYKNPIGTASIGQVYRARLKEEQEEEVVLKVRRPKVLESVKADLHVLNKVIDVAEQIPELADYEPRQLYNAFEASMLEEIDYSNEARLISRFELNYKEDTKIKVPHLYHQWCAENLICMELIKGVKFNEIEKVKQIFPDLNEVTTIICDYYFDQILDKGLFHADPHPGNIYVLEDRRICLLDYGMVGEVLPDDKDQIALLFFYLINQNIGKTIKVLEKISINFNVSDRKSLEYDIHRLINDFNAPLENVNAAQIIGKLFNILRKNQIALPSYVYLILRTLAYLDGIVRSLSPDLNVLKFAEPYAHKAMQNKMNPKTRLKDLAEDAIELEEATRKLPVNLNNLMHKLETDELIIKTELSDMKQSLVTIEKSTNKVVLALLVGSLLIGSSLVVLSKIPPYVNEIPILGVIGYVIASILSMILIFRYK